MQLKINTQYAILVYCIVKCMQFHLNHSVLQKVMCAVILEMDKRYCIVLAL